jgi:uncharacterized membrane protein YphA (DoxX/SURF4 family)
MDSKDDQVTLTSREQQLLAELERATSHSDPHLDTWLRTARRSWIHWSATRQLIVAVLALVAGTALMLGTFTRWLWVAALAALVQAGAFGLGIRGWTQRRQAKSPD